MLELHYPMIQFLIILVICNNTKDNFLLEPQEIDVKLQRNIVQIQIKFHT